MVKQKIVVYATIFILFLNLAACSQKDSKIEVFFEKGSSPRTIALKLKKSGLILSATAFIAVIKLSGDEKHLKAGRYEFNSSDNMLTILSKIKNGKNLNIKITVPEGFDIKKIGLLLEEKGICKSSVFEAAAKDKNMEGFLLPETYFIDPKSSADEVIKIMNDEFNKFWSKDFEKRAGELNMTKRDIIILSSIVEKEAVSANERSVIAGIFYNRLSKKMRLESCSTVLYAMGINKERLSFEDLRFNSPYNTYKYAGLPPGPICNPGKETIKAVLFPKETPYLYFVSKGDGTHMFAMTLNEHVIQKKDTKKMIKKAKNEKKKNLS